MRGLRHRREDGAAALEFGLVAPVIFLLIFGVSAAASATSVTTPFMTPFLILCALTLGALASAPFAVAAALRHMSE